MALTHWPGRCHSCAQQCHRACNELGEDSMGSRTSARFSMHEASAHSACEAAELTQSNTDQTNLAPIAMQAGGAHRGTRGGRVVTRERLPPGLRTAVSETYATASPEAILGAASANGMAESVSSGGRTSCVGTPRAQASRQWREPAADWLLKRAAATAAARPPAAPASYAQCGW